MALPRIRVIIFIAKEKGVTAFHFVAVNILNLASGVGLPMISFWGYVFDYIRDSDWTESTFRPIVAQDIFFNQYSVFSALDVFMIMRCYKSTFYLLLLTYLAVHRL